jgi:hypothetical protein
MPAPCACKNDPGGILKLRYSLLCPAIAFAAALALPSVMPAQTARPLSAASQQPVKAKADAKAFDPHDLSGIWTIADRTQLTVSDHRPPFTPWGQEKFSKVRMSWTNAALGIQAYPEKDWNDPLFQCDPAGYPRVMLQIFGELMRFVQTRNELIEFFEWDHTWRDIWTDGRKLLDDPEPRYYGFSVGHWEGNTFVVESNGFDERTWIDPFGDVHSDQMRLKETFRRVDHDHLEWTLTVIDPMTYTQPWGPSDKRVFNLVPKSPRSETQELREDFCVWSDSAGFFKNVDPTGVGDAPARGDK